METAAQSGSRRLADFLRERHDEIMARWEVEVRHLRPAKFLTRPALLDHVPDFLRQLADFVDSAREQHDEAASPQQFPVIHALERLDLGYDLEEVVAEYGILRHCISALAQSSSSPALFSAELPRLHQAIDMAIATSVSRYSNARERTLKALDRISTAALGVSEIEQFLPRTLAALLETTAAIDSASILLIEGDRLHVKAAAGLVVDPAESTPLKRGECFAGMVWQAGQPLHVRDAEHDDRITTNTIRKRGTRALYGVPLLLGTDVIGVAVMGSTSTYEFSHEDLLLFRTAVNRAAALVAQARLDDTVRRQTALYQSILSALGDIGEGFALIENERVVMANEALCHIVGRSSEELHALGSVLEIFEPAEREAMRARLNANDGPAGRHEAALLHKDGTRVEVELGVKRKATGRVVVVVHDVTARSKLEHERAEQRARLETVLRVLPVGVVIAEAPSGKLLLGNAEADRIWGKPTDAQSVEAYGSYEGYWPDGRRVAASEWPLARAVRHGESTGPEEIHLVAEDGEKRITELRAAPILDEAGNVTAGVVTLVDVTGRKQAEEELRSTLAFRDRLLDILAHDLRQPLSVVGTSAAMLLRQEGLEDHAHVFARQLRNVERMDRLIRDLLDYARSRQGVGIPIRRRPADLRELVQQAIDSIQTLHSDRSITVECDGDCKGEFDPDRMLQVFGNLLGNAVQYSPRGTAVEVRLHDRGAELLCEVHNFGQAIPAERLATIFEPFRRGTNRANPQGLGLGLYIVERIVAAHGGEVKVSSTEGKGTTLSLRLPKR